VPLDVVPWGIVIAALGGLAIGVEREWSGHATGPQARFAGVRTFTLLGGVGGIAGWLWLQQAEALAIVLLAASAGLVLIAYTAASRTEIGGTTEVGALVVLAAGTLAGIGYLGLCSAIIALTSLLLLEKSKLHTLVGRIDDAELRAAVRFAVMAVVILPLLPVGPYGPWDAFRPRQLWLFVLLFSGLSFAGYIARRMFGARRGYVVAGLLGGLISSTSVTLTFARASRDADAAHKSMAYGAIAACTVLFVRVSVAVAALNPGLLLPLVTYLVWPVATGTVIVLLGIRSLRAEPGRPGEKPRNPLQLSTALKMAALFQTVLVIIALVNRTWGDLGVTTAGAVVGLADVDALTLSMARSAGGSIAPPIAAQAIAVGTLSDALLKLTLALTIGRGVFRRTTATGLAALALALGVSLAVGAW
jgi:uncharacterized membrane protein (DUF4010 family)